ncbi:MAG: cysteine dioxygenase [Gemmatimonadales bacterium]
MTEALELHTPETRHFLERLDRAVEHADPHELCGEVKAALQEAIDLIQVPAAFLAEASERYARRLLHRCPDGTYSVLVMVWAPGQGTPVHDHAGKWCVECVHTGEIEITTFDPTSDVSLDVVRFSETGREVARRGDVGILVPPNEYHRIKNAANDTAVTMHVYAGEMLWCHAFHPTEEAGSYRKERLALRYNQ